jgi:predicted transcriptional regulator
LKYPAGDFITASQAGEMDNTREALVQVGKAPMRSRVEIMANILNETSLSSKGLRRTRMMYRCNLSTRQLKIYVKLLSEKGFLNVSSIDSSNGTNRKVNVYQITEGGLSFLKAYGDLKRRMREGILLR